MKKVLLAQLMKHLRKAKVKYLHNLNVQYVSRCRFTEDIKSEDFGAPRLKEILQLVEGIHHAELVELLALVVQGYCMESRNATETAG